MDDFVFVARGATRALVHPDFHKEALSALLEGEGCRPVALGGRRDSLQQFPIGGAVGLVRQYRRGGLARFFLRDKYLLANRPLRELKALLHARSAGVSVPEPLGVVWKRTGLAYSGAIATLRLEGITLLEYLRSGPVEGSRLEECGRAIRKMHDSGTWHADLQLANIVVGPSRVTIIDFDNARARNTLSRLARSRNLLRLERSFSKNAIPSRWFSRVRDGYGAFRIPQGLEAAYKLKGRVSDALAGRHPQTRYRSERIGLAPSRDLKAVQDSLEDGGVLLKKSDKFRTRRVGDWVVKETTARGLIPTLKLTLLRKRYRRAWEAARFLQSQGIHVPAPIAYAEGGAFGIVTGNAVISEFLDGHRNVEDHARALEAESPHDRAQAESFLSAVADAVNALTAAGAYHSDLSGKNIFTADGQTCRFIDLEAVRLNRRYTRVERLTNHVQLCDSFCDLWDDELLGPFIEKMTPRDWDGKAWFAKVRQVQRRRRTHHLDETSGLGPVGRIRRHVGGWLSRRTR